MCCSTTARTASMGSVPGDLPTPGGSSVGRPSTARWPMWPPHMKPAFSMVFLPIPVMPPKPPPGGSPMLGPESPGGRLARRPPGLGATRDLLSRLEKSVLRLSKWLSVSLTLSTGEGLDSGVFGFVGVSRRAMGSGLVGLLGFEGLGFSGGGFGSGRTR